LKIGASLAADLGTTPAFDPGVRAWLLVPTTISNHYTLRFAGMWLADQRKAGTVSASRGADVSFAAFAVQGCGSMEDGLFEAGFCAGPEVGWLHASSYGTNPATADGVPWLAAGAEVSGAVVLFGPVSLGLELGFAFPLHQWEVTLDNVGSIYQVSPLVLRGGIGTTVPIP
jgi:hypothetical protein